MKDDLFLEGCSYHTTSLEQVIVTIIPPVRREKSSTLYPDQFVEAQGTRMAAVLGFTIVVHR